MRFKRGSKVEVLSKKEVPLGSWFCAEIISGNGRYYVVRYDWSISGIHEAIIEKVSRKALRPCPPHVEFAENWVPGDVVEVFHSGSWKIATVSKIMNGVNFVVRLLGSSQEFRVHKTDLRVRQFWKDDEWVAVGKGLGNRAHGKSNKLSASNQKSGFQVPQINAKKLHVEDDCFPFENNIAFQESHMVSSRTLKRRSPYCLSDVEADTVGRKLRALEKVNMRQQMAPGPPIPLTDKGESWRLEHLASKGLKATLLSV